MVVGAKNANAVLDAPRKRMAMEGDSNVSGIIWKIENSDMV